jgi:uncharacterized protein YqjF (DUF2071 family)
LEVTRVILKRSGELIRRAASVLYICSFITKNKTMTFLSAEWRNIILVNYAVKPSLLQAHLPHGVEIDLFRDTCYVSLVGFMFVNTRILGLPIPLHRDFEEINLRFYVRKKVNGSWRRGVVFVSEIVSKRAISLVARTLYREPYTTMPTRHSWEENETGKRIEYRWEMDGKWQHVSAEAERRGLEIGQGSKEEFITEHYYGYTRWNNSKTREYEVQHPRWLLNPVKNYHIGVDFAALYGEKFGFLTRDTPRSVLLAEGSAVRVKTGRSI